MEKIIKYIMQNYSEGNIDKSFAKGAVSFIVKESKKVNNEDIAIIGMSINASGCENVYDYWDVIENGIDCIRDFPKNRIKEIEPFVVRRYGEKKSFIKGAYLEDVSHFDYKFFHCTPKEATLMDPNHKVFLEVAWKALEDSGYLNDNVHKSNTGIFLGYSPAIGESYQEMINIVDKGDVSTSIPFNVSSIAASRISYLLDLKGPSMVIDSACSSGLVAVDTAIKYLKEKNCDMAIAGGIRLHLLPVDDEDYRMGIESVDGHTRTFDGESTGAGTGEGAAAIVLKRLSDAIKDKDNIYAVIKGSSINQDGRSIGITAPNPVSQKELIIDAWKNSGIEPDTIDYVETHGTGTPLGDPIELNSLSNAFKVYTDKKNFCAVSSVKSNIGHMFECAGIVSIIKAVLALNNKIIPKTINYNKVNSKMDFIDSPLYINTINREWEKKDHPRRCGVSSFGYSGTNAHLILEEYPVDSVGISDEEKDYVFVFSANSKISLENQLKKYEKYEAKIRKIDTKKIAWTLSFCRKHYEYRLVIIARSTQDLLEKIKLVNNNGIEENTKWSSFSYHKVVSNTKDIKMDYEITQTEKEKLSREADAYLCNNYEDIISNISKFYCLGADINWEKFYGNNSINQKVSLPGYEFDKHESWIDTNNIEVTKVVILNNNKSKIINKKNSNELKILGKDKCSEIEIGICRILADILGFKEIDVYDNFIELGLDSVSMMHVIASIKDKFHVTINFNLFGQEINVIKLADIIINSSKLEDSNQKSKGDIENRYTEFGLTSIQRAYIMGREKYYNLGNTSTHIYLEYETKLDFSRLERALNKVIKKHPMLRAVILKELKQKILSEVPWYKIEQVDMMNSSFIDGEKCRYEEREKMSHQIFDTEKWPLFSIKGIKTKNKNYLLVSLDLLIADGISLQIFLKDLYLFYNDENLLIQEPEYTFRDYILDYSKLKGSNEYIEAKIYWEKRIEGIINPPSLPLMKKIEDVESPHFLRKQMNFGGGSLKRLREVAQIYNVTISAILCTAYAETLRKWSSKNNFIINIASYNRHIYHECVNEMIGDFTSVLLLAVDYSSHLFFWDKVKYIQNNIIEGIQNRCFDGVDVIAEELTKSGDYAKALFPAVFTSLITDEDLDMSFFGKEVYGANQTPQVYLDYQARSQNGEIIIVWDYIDELLNDEMITEMFVYNNSILNNVINNVDCVSPVNYITNKLITYNETYTEYKLEPFVTIFNRQAKIFKNKDAIILENEKISYEDLNLRSNKMANFLCNNNVGKGDYVGVITERKIESIINIISVLKTGAAYVPIDINYPEERQKFIINNNNCKVVLKCDSYNEYRIDELNGIFPEVSYSIQDIMYTIYTSGSTGMPKGVIITQESAMNTIIDINQKFGVNSDDRLIGVSSFCFDLSVYDVFASLIAGATLVMVKDQRDINNLITVIQRENITIWNSVPAIMNLVVQNTDVIHSALRLVMLSGDWIPLKLPEKVKKIFPKSQIISLGGATEGAIWSIYYPIKDINETWRSIPYGMPLANQKMYILNDDLEQCPTFVEGEICIGGMGVAQGYCGNEEKTKEAFIDHNEFGYIYRTGDYGVFSDDGYIIFLGRKDMQIKINGYRVELGEIEKCLCSVEGVKEAAVVINEEVGKNIHAFVTVSKDLNISDILNQISKHIPNYMMPKQLQIISEFKLTSNGKIDYKALSEITISNCVSNKIEELIKPVTDTEFSVLKIIKEISNNNNLSLNSKLFDIGIDSVLLISMLTKLNKKFSIDLSIEKIFRAKNIKEICDLVKASDKTKQQIITKADTKEYYETSHMQRKLYLACVNNTERNKSYNINHAIIVEGDLYEDLCKEVINKLIYRHEALRTCIKEVNGTIVQKVKDCVNYNINIIDSDSNYIDEIIKNNSFYCSVDDESLFEFSIIRFAEDKKILLFNIHHIVADGISLHILMEDFIKLYKGESLDELNIQYKDYVEWDNSKKDLLNTKERQYWKKVLEVLPVNKLPKDFYVEKQSSFEGDVIVLNLAEDVYQKLKKISYNSEYTIFMYLFATANMLLSKYYSSNDIIIGITSSGRNNESIANVIGMFVKTLPIRIKINNSIMFSNLLQQIKQVILAGTENQNFDVEDIYNELHINGSMLYDTIFSYQFYDTSTLNIDGVTFKNYDVLNTACKVPLEFSIIEFNNKIDINIIYSKELFLHSTIRGIADKYADLLECLLENVDDTIETILTKHNKENQMEEVNVSFNF